MVMVRSKKIWGDEGVESLSNFSVRNFDRGEMSVLLQYVLSDVTKNPHFFYTSMHMIFLQVKFCKIRSAGR
jgi:hypothetical protein